MTLAAGSKLGPYEIQCPLGAGGMGEVYRARDTRLERTVAIKILPAQFSADPVCKQRFEREAKTISSLNHPNICTLHDVGSQDGVDYLVMECVEGETLAKRLEKGALSLEQVLKYGAQIADALDKAHRAGIVHRDLKPGNIMLTPAGAKLLDFGLAKPAVPLANLATLTASAVKQSPATAEGTIVGTFQYMSPEQIEGKEIDGRSDTFSLGAVLYEMLTGQRAFDGKSQLSVASAILEKEPTPLTTIKPMTPPALEHAIKKCLAKTPEERWQSASDLSSELKWVSESGSQDAARAISPATGKSWLRGGWLVSGVLLLLLASLGVAWWMRTLQNVRAMYFSSPVRFAANNVALSPDGKRLAMVAYAQQVNKYMIWTQEIGGRIATAVPGTEDASHPFWSPDGRSIGFFSQGQLKKVDVFSGRAAQVLCEAPSGRGGTWNRDGVILFAPEGHGSLCRVSSGGGIPTPVTTVNANEFSHRWPVFLPDGQHFLYLAANFSGHLESNWIAVGSLTGERHNVVNASSNAVYADPGYLLYLRDNVLVAQRFDPRTFLLSGDAHAISDEVQYSQLIDLALFDAVGTKTLAVQSGKGTAKSQLTWYERNGRPAGTVGTPDAIANPNLSPDGRRIVYDQIDRDGQNINIWIDDLRGGVPARLTFGAAADQCPVWTPDGARITFGSNRSFHFTIYQKNADGSGAEAQAVDTGSPQSGPWDWSRDGKHLLIMRNGELWYLNSADWQPKPFLQPKGNVRNAQFSPDGNWVAYASSETGIWQVYVSAFPNPTSKRQISMGGGQEPRWRKDGKELFYLSADAKLMAVPVKLGSTIESGPAEALFQTHARQHIGVMDAFSYDVSRDGQKFLINVKVDEPSPAPLSIILNWAEEVKEK